MWPTCNWKYIVNCKANTSCNPCNTCNTYYIKLCKTLICVLHVLHVLHGTITGRMTIFQVLHVCYMCVTCDQQRIIIISEVKRPKKNISSFYKWTFYLSSHVHLTSDAPHISHYVIVTHILDCNDNYRAKHFLWPPTICILRPGGPYCHYSLAPPPAQIWRHVWRHRWHVYVNWGDNVNLLPRPATCPFMYLNVVMASSKWIITSYLCFPFFLQFSEIWRHWWRQQCPQHYICAILQLLSCTSSLPLSQTMIYQFVKD